MATAPRALLRIRRAGHTVPNMTPSTPILDFLLPSYVPRATAGPSVAQAGQRHHSVTPLAISAHSKSQGPARRRKAVLPFGRCEQSIRRSASGLSSSAAGSVAAKPISTWYQCRSFTSTQRRTRTETVLNPQVDDDGKEMKLEITPRAATRLSKVMEKDDNPHLALRIQVESGGCHGFQYLMSLVTLPSRLPAPNASSADAAEAEVESQIVRDDDTIFSYIAEDETVAGGRDPLTAPKIILDTPSLELLNGSKVDFTMELIGSQFKIVDNPHATSSCGCGTSFDIKI